MRSRRPLAALTAMILAVALAACGGGDGDGGSAQETATKQVCDARADIKKQIDTVKGLPLTSDSVGKVASGLDAVRADLQQIADAQGELDDDRKQQVESAVKTFSGEVRSIAASAVAAGATGDAGDAVRSAADKLGASFEEALQPIDCD